MQITGGCSCTEAGKPFYCGMHSHDDYEIYCFLEGKAEYYVEGSRYVLEPGDLMLMRKGEVHMPNVSPDLPYRRMNTNFEISDVLEAADAKVLLTMFRDRPAGAFNHYPARMFPGHQWESNLQKLIQAESQQLKLCYLMAMLGELTECFEKLKQESSVPPTESPMVPVIQFINQNLDQDLSLDLLSDRFFVSKAHLNRLFQRTTGTTVWQYIVLKRMQLARKLLRRGGKPTEVYLQCGYRDYATFYRAYHRQFGIPPRDTR